jgi:hypothetical protein
MSSLCHPNPRFDTFAEGNSCKINPATDEFSVSTLTTFLFQTDLPHNFSLNKMCSKQACKQACQQVVTICYFIKLLQGCHLQLVDKLLNCRTITSCWNNLQQVCWAQQPCSKLSRSRWQLVNKLGISSANTSCWQVVGTALLQVCCRFVTTCAFLRGWTRNPS